MFKDSTCSFAGAELDAMKIDGAPDYYARKNKRIFLFESKDFLIPIKAKDTFDLNIYEEEFTKKLYYKIKNNGREVNKAILQLIEMVRNTFCDGSDGSRTMVLNVEFCGKNLNACC